MDPQYQHVGTASTDAKERSESHGRRDSFRQEPESNIRYGGRRVVGATTAGLLGAAGDEAQIRAKAEALDTDLKRSAAATEEMLEECFQAN